MCELSSSRPIYGYIIFLGEGGLLYQMAIRVLMITLDAPGFVEYPTLVNQGLTMYINVGKRVPRSLSFRFPGAREKGTLGMKLLHFFMDWFCPSLLKVVIWLKIITYRY